MTVENVKDARVTIGLDAATCIPGSVPSDLPPAINTLHVRENGPLAIEAALVLNGTPATSPRITLCRCGRSQMKPLCDGAHAAAGFVAPGEPATRASAPLAKRNGPVQLQTVQNGPLRLTGNLELLSGTGRTINRVTKVTLCRCGQSGSKPYCDGSHLAAGFKAT